MIDEYEGDVVFEGSDLHKALNDIGYTDFECIPINRSVLPDDTAEVYSSQKSLSPIKHGWLQNLIQLIKNYYWLYKPKIKSHGVTQLEIISQLDPLLDDHSIKIQNMLAKKTLTSDERYIPRWPMLMVCNSLFATGVSLCKPLRIPGFIVIAFINTSILYQTYRRWNASHKLKELVTIQNNVYCIFKRAMRILKNGYCLKLTQGHSQKRFSALEIQRIKYLQPMCEYFINSIEQVTHTCYQMSLLLMNLPKETSTKIYMDDFITKFDDTMLNNGGEITYEKLKQHYYIYILVQSEMMQILAILYQDKSINDHRVNSQLIKILDSLLHLFKKQKTRLNNIIEKYKSTKAPIIRHELKNKIEPKLQDFYVHMDLLARKIRSAYTIVDSIIDDIDSCPNNEKSNEILDLIVEKMNRAFKEIDTAKNFAEFNNLLISKFKQNQSLGDNKPLNNNAIGTIEKILPVVRDTDPEIIDEVFEEYIKDEYLKPLYEDECMDSLEKSKLDKLLAKNFMSELKEVLIDKYKCMSEREERALSCYRKKKYNTDQEYFMENKFVEEVTISPPTSPLLPPPPPPPPAFPESTVNENFLYSQQIKIHPPVPLPRSMNPSSSPIAYETKKYEYDSEPEILDHERFLPSPFNINTQQIKLPIFTTEEETFVGSGENSEEEIILDSDDVENVNCS